MIADGERRRDLFVRKELQPDSSHQVSLDLSERAVRDRKVISVATDTVPPMSLRDVRRDGGRCSEELIFEPERFFEVDEAPESMALCDEVQSPLPDHQICVSLNGHVLL